MAAADEILGISGQMDISDIQSSLDKLCNGLNRVGVETEALSQKMNKALNDVAQSDEDLATKTTKAMQVLKSAMDEASKGIQVVPEMIDTANKRVETIEGTIGKLNEQLAKTEKNSEAFTSITKQIDVQKQSLQLAKEDVTKLSRSYENVKNSISEVSGAYQALNSFSVASSTLNSIQSTSNVAVGASATAAATATTAEAAAHTANAAAAMGNADAENQNAQATQQLTAALEEYMSVSSGRVEIERMQSESIKELKEDIKLYENGIKEIQNTIDSSNFAGKIEETTAKIEVQKTKIEQYKSALANLSKDDNASGNGVYYYNKLIEAAQQKIDKLQSKIENWEQEQQRLNADLQEYNTLLDAAKKIQAGENLSNGYKKATDEAKNAAKETKNIGKEAENATKKVGGIFSKFKNILNGALKGNFSALFSFFGKIGVWGAALGTIGKGLYELTIRAEEFRNALQPLSHYLNNDTLKDVRQNIIALSGATAKSESDMAAAATQFVKVWDSLRNSPEAITAMIKSSNEFGALAGKTSEEGAKFLSNLASEYHMTAQEATEASTMIATAARNSTSSFGEMADAISSAGSSAALYGVSFKEMATLIGYSSNQFGGAQKAASKFSMLLMSMSKMQDKYNPSVVGMITALQNLKDAYDRGEHVENNFMARQRSIALYFIKNADAIAKYNKRISDNTAKQDLLNDINARASVNVAKLQNAWNGFLTSINANLTPTLTKILKFFTRIIGGAQKTARELNYIKNYDKVHPQTTKNINSKYTSNPYSGVDPQQDIIDRKIARDEAIKEGYEKYDKQEAFLSAKYRNQYKYFRNRYKNASEQAILNAANNSMVKYYEKNREKYTEFNSQTFNEWLREKMSYTRSMNQKPINSNTNLGGNSYIPKTKKDKIAEQRKYREQLAEQQAKQLADDEKIKWDLYVAEQENIIAKTHDGNEKELKQRKLDFEKKKHQIEEERKTLLQQNIQTAKALYEKNPDNKGKEGFYASRLDKNVKLTTEQAQLIQTKLETLNAEYENESKKRLQEELQSLYDYLKQYGTVQEQRYAIAKEYDEKIQKAANDNQKKLLQKQKESALSQVDARNLALNIDWGATFQGVGNVLGDIAKDVLSKVEEYMKTAEFKGLDASDKKTYVELRQNLRKETSGGTSPFNLSAWNNIAQQVTTYQNSVKKLKDASEAHTQALKNLENAEQEMKKATTDKARQIAQVKVIVGRKAVKMTGEIQQKAQEKVGQAQNDLADSTNKAAEGMQNFQTVLGNLTSGSLSGFANGVAALINSLTGGTKNVGNALQELGGKIGGLIGAILQIMDALGDTPVQFIDNLLSKIATVIEAVISNIPQIQLSVLKGVGNIVGSVIKGLGNVFSGGALFGGNQKKMEAEIAKLSEANETLAKSIEGLKDAITDDDATNKQSREAYQKAIAAQKEYNENQRQAIKDRAKEYSNSGHGFLGLGGRGSFNAYANDNKGAWLGAFNQALQENGINKTLTSAQDVWDLSPEEMKVLQDFSPKAWAAFFSSGGQANPQSLVEEYISQAGALDGLTDALNEKLTGYTWDGFRDSYASLLKDLESETADFGDFINKTISNAIIESLITSPEVQARIKEIYKMIADATDENSDKGEDISKDEADAIRKKNESLANDLLKARQELEDLGLIKPTKSEQSATSKAIEAITADQASALTGIGYAMQIALEQGNNTRNQISVDVSVMRSYAETTALNVSEMRDIQYEGLGQLQQIVKNTAPIILIREDIASMYKLMKDRY